MEINRGVNQENIFDLLVIGGGVNGTGIARDAAGRGLSVLLCEQDDLARYTSSSSTKLIHGGLRYLEQYDFKLVRNSLQEREVLLRSAPHIIWPLRFILPHYKALRPRWLIRLGLFIYDHLGKREILPASKGVNLRRHISGEALKPEFTHGFEYSDCWVQDARLVVLNAVDAEQHGARILTRTKCIALSRGQDSWTATLEDLTTRETSEVMVRSVVNAAGPWVEQVAGLDRKSQSAHGVRLVKGSHIIVPKIFDHDYVYLFQNSDRRIMFAIPYESDFTLLGTTDVEVSADPAEASTSDQEVQYICDNVNRYFARPVTPADVVHTYCGVRPLFDDAAKDASKTTRDYVLHMNDQGPPVISVYGGKLTTYRILSEEVMDMLVEALDIDAQAWTCTGILPGGDFPEKSYPQFVESCRKRYPWCVPGLIDKLARNYGSRIEMVIGEAAAMDQLGQHFGDMLYEAEARYLVEHEWARTVDDIVWRRTRAGLWADPALLQKLEHWLAGVG
jgi:glycerol-3-phosphate dehydrogenase